MSSSEELSTLSPTEAFSLLGDETRLSILRVLAASHQANPQTPGLSFAECRKRVGVEDAGKFNYHLGKLRGHFIEKVDGRYRLRVAGVMIVSAILAGTYTERGGKRETETAHTCPICENALTATYEDELVGLNCTEHGTVFQTTLPPGAAVDRSMDELLVLANRRTQQDIESVLNGVCPFCWGRIDATEPTAEDGQLIVDFACERCWFVMHVPVGMCVVRHPAVVSLLYDHGIDVRTELFVDLAFVAYAGTLVSTDPTRVRVDIELDSDVIRLTVDDTLTVVNVERPSE